MDVTLPSEGALLGLDVGYSEHERKTGLGFLSWTPKEIHWSVSRTGSSGARRVADLKSLVPAETFLLGIGIDGPLAKDCKPVSGYRCADFLFSQGVLQYRGSAAPANPANEFCIHTQRLAQLVLQLENEGYWQIKDACHSEAIQSKSIVEAHPTHFLGIMIDEECLPAASRKNRSDAYFVHLARGGKLDKFVTGALPGRVLHSSLSGITGHEERAGLVCTLTALAVLRKQYVACGDANDGYIMLAGRNHWGKSKDDPSMFWAEAALRKNAEALRTGRYRKVRYASSVSLTENGIPW